MVVVFFLAWVVAGGVVIPLRLWLVAWFWFRGGLWCVGGLGGCGLLGFVCCGAVVATTLV